MRFIEVLAIVREEREVDGYEVNLDLTTSAKKKVACFDQALVLRESIVSILHKSGLSDADICEGGGTIDQSSWSSTKSVIHRISIRKNNMDVLMAAMAATERYFAALPRPFFARIKQDFTFHTPQPHYKSNSSAVESLRKSIQNARQTAEEIAHETGYRLGGLISVVEQHLDRFQEATDDKPVDTDDNLSLGEHDSLQALAYSSLPTNTAKKSRRFHVRFAVEDAEAR